MPARTTSLGKTEDRAKVRARAAPPGCQLERGEKRHASVLTSLKRTRRSAPSSRAKRAGTQIPVPAAPTGCHQESGKAACRPKVAPLERTRRSVARLSTRKGGMTGANHNTQITRKSAARLSTKNEKKCDGGEMPLMLGFVFGDRIGECYRFS